MINSYDIRKGIFLYYPFTPEEDALPQYRIGKVDGINRYNDVEISNEEDGYKEIKTAHLKPIEVNEEYFVAFTFEKADIKWKDGKTFKDIWALKFDHTIYVIEKTEILGYVLYQEDPFGNRNFIKILKYVHELQNIFRELTKSNLPYKPLRKQPF